MDNYIIAILPRINGLVGRKYKNDKEAIEDGGYSVWNNEKIKSAFNFGNGTIEDFNRYLKNNEEHTISSEQFRKIVESLTDRNSHFDFVEKSLKTF